MRASGSFDFAPRLATMSWRRAARAFVLVVALFVSSLALASAAGSALGAPETAPDDTRYWTAVVDDARAVRIDLVPLPSEPLEREIEADVRSAMTSIAAGLDRMADPSRSPDLGESALTARRHHEALTAVLDRRGALDARAAANALGALIEDTDELVDLERALAVEQLEVRSVEAIRTLGGRLATFTLAGVTVAFALVGIGDGLRRTAA